MTEPNRFAVPLDSLEEVHVGAEDLTEEASSTQRPDAAQWGGRLTPAYGDGGHTGQDGDGD